MTIAEMRERSNSALSRVPKDLLVVGVIVLSSTASFGLGMLTSQEMGLSGALGKGREMQGFWVETLSTTSAKALPAAVQEANLVPQAQEPLPVAGPGTPVTPKAGKYVASKTGKKYYLPTCSGAARIKEANRVWFATVEDAKAAGLTPASNCPGL